MLIRKREETINNWIEGGDKALLIYGARQVGKTFVIRKCVNNSRYKLLEFNLIRTPEAIKALEASETSKDLLMNFSLLTNEKFIPKETIIFLDEIQEYKEIITKIKFFVEEGIFKFILSGSLLGVELRNIKSAPVGYLQSFIMYPLDFEEFLQIYNVPKDILMQLKKSFDERSIVQDFIHDRFMKMFKQYLVVGGMPAAVQKFVTTSDLDEVILEHESIISSYKLDFTKYEEENKKLEITKIYDLIPSELNAKNKRFNFKSVKDNFIYDRNKDNFLWLTNAGVAIPVYNSTEPMIPLLINEKSSLFKLFLSDVGLLSTIYGKSFKSSILNANDNINNGAIYENVVAQELTAHSYRGYYYSSKKFGELDFVIEAQNEIIPIEVKSGKDYKKHSALNNVLEVSNYNINTAFVFTNDNISVDGRITYYPIYMIMFIKEKDEKIKIDFKSLKF